MRAVPFDRVVLGVGAAAREITAAEFLRLPLQERINHVLCRTVAFYSGGSPVAVRDALRRLRDSVAPPKPGPSD